ncbi:MAG: hypothetical protein JSV85_05370 [Candidatus Bathyarchaeota archaeon]|nr:MAG: hypothetical protein JSV85_05370 [Candidatus Bathyarchaeota archaeon]
MTKRPMKDEALEALDFIINVLREHEKDLDGIVTKLSKTIAKFSKTGEITTKIEKIEERLSTMQNEISNLVHTVSPSQKTRNHVRHGSSVTVRCKQWEDFRTLAADAETISFLYKQEEKVFQADALKEGKILTYTGEFPQDSNVLKIWLSRELNVPEDRIFEGALAMG